MLEGIFAKNQETYLFPNMLWHYMKSWSFHLTLRKNKEKT